MNKVQKVKAFIIGAGIALAVPALAQPSGAPGAYDAVHPSLLAHGSQLIRFAEVRKDLGTLTEDDAPVTCRFMGKNVSSQPVFIQRIHTTCGCTAAQLSRRELQPGDTCVVQLTYTAKNHPGTIDADAFVYLSVSDKHPAARLTLTGNVVPGADEWARFRYSMGALRLKQNKVKFTGVSKGMEPEARILCGNSSKEPLQITALLIPRFTTLRTEPEVIPPGEEADLVITLHPDKFPQGKQENLDFPVILDGVKGKPSDRTIHVEVCF